MDETVHLYSRPVTPGRLCAYIVLICSGIAVLLVDSSRSAIEPGAPAPVFKVKFQQRLVTPPAPSPERAEAPVKERTEAVRPTVKVKTGYHAIIRQVGQQYGVESALIQAIIMAESSYNPRAVSSRGAVGLMQLMPITADSMGVEDSFDPQHNIDGGVRYFKHLLDRFEGDTRLALAAYNAGAKKVRQYNGVPPYKATRSYIDKVMQYYQRYKDLEYNGTSRV